uniref:Replication factor C subunit 1 n=1 Tax=Trichuris muris TaxID=70415 RepID=A0A5S6QZ50_TRIMR
MDIRNFLSGKSCKGGNTKKEMPKAKGSKSRKPIPTYTSDASDAEDPVPSKVLKRYRENKEGENVNKRPSRQRKGAKEPSSDDSDFAEEPKISKKSSAKVAKHAGPSKQAPVRPISAEAYFQGAQEPTGLVGTRFRTLMKKGSDVLDSPESMEMARPKRSPHKRRTQGSDLEELLDNDQKPSVPSPAKKRESKAAVGSPQKVATTSSPAKASSAKSPRKKAEQKKEKSDRVQEQTTAKTKQTPKKVDKPGGDLESPQKLPHEQAASKRRSYVDYLKREGPRALGSKEIPEGTEECLAGLTFVISGILESITREDARALILKHGGRVTSAVSHKTNYLLLGRDGGESKSAKARELGVQTLTDDGLYDLIRLRSARELKKVEESPRPPKKRKKANDSTTTVVNADGQAATDAKKGQFSLWTEKYKPTNLKQVIGQQGPKSCLNKLLAWLRSWNTWHGNGANKATGAKKLAASDDGHSFKAALLSGPPGIGKTTTAQLCCKELRLSFVELNASDARNKKLLEQSCSASLASRCLDQYYCDNVKPDFDSGLNHVLIMDEVDGMSGNEDRAGIQGLIDMIKRTRVPIICICNDRQSPKIRSLANYCFDLRFHRPQTLQIRSALMSVVHKEGLRVPPQALDQLVEASQHDIRQVLHNLCLMTTSNQGVTFDEARKSVRKDVNTNIFEATRILFTNSEGSKQLSLGHRAEIFFTDYSLVPLFVQENYVHSVTANNTLDRLTAMAEAAQLIASGDIVDKHIRTLGNWSLLNVQATFSTVIPTELMKGYLQGLINFPAWFGKNSKIGRLFRQLQQLHLHTCLHASSDTASICLDYIDHMRNSLIAYLVREDVAGALGLCQSYDMSKDDVDTIMELGSWPHRKDPMAKLPSKTKAAFTRAFNASTYILPYDIVGATLNRRKRQQADVLEYGKEAVDATGQPEEDSSSEDEDTAFMKAAKVKTAPGKGRATSGKGRSTAKKAPTAKKRKAPVKV